MRLAARTVNVCLYCAVALALPPLQAQPVPPGPTGSQETTLDKDDQGFLERAARSSLFETQAAKMALQKSRNPDIKAYAGQMVKENSATLQDLTKLALSKHFDLPSELSIEQKIVLKSLDVADSSFDTKYIQRWALPRTTMSWRCTTRPGSDPRIKTSGTLH